MSSILHETEYVPGTNLKGTVSGANWTFALPKLEFEQVLCLGAPPAKALRTLSRLGRRVVVVVDDAEARRRVVASAAGNTLSNVATITPEAPDELPVHSGSTDLLVPAEPQRVQRLMGSAALRAECRRVLAADGLIYLEMRSLRGPESMRRQIEAVGGEFGPAADFWLTPVAGEGKTVVNSGDDATRQFFLDLGLDAASVTANSVKGFLKRKRKNPAAAAAANGSTNGSTNGSGGRKNVSRRARRAVAPLLRRAGRAFVSTCQQMERGGRHSRMISDRIHRSAFLIGNEAQALQSGPPRYLCELAKESGIDISAHRWGLVAAAGYESRKVLFFLFREQAERPEYIVKMTRNSQYNGRLERECGALNDLHGRNLPAAAALPRVAFSGTHGGLAILGQTIVEGMPFERRPSTVSAEDFAGDAAGWLTELGHCTATKPETGQPQISERLEDLLDQFYRVYRPDDSLRQFLGAQLTALKETSHPVPLVFQHGDPGIWNVLVTDEGRTVLLDWEAADPCGIPLWDLFYFLRSYGVAALPANGRGNKLTRTADLFVAESPLGDFVVERASEYCRQLGIDSEAVAPLFYTCWMHRALKEATRLPVGRLSQGHYYRFLQKCVEHHRSPQMARLLSAE